MSKILIIEDEAAIAELERDYLEISGFDVDISLDGDEGLYKALKGIKNLKPFDENLYSFKSSSCFLKLETNSSSV